MLYHGCHGSPVESGQGMWNRREWQLRAGPLAVLSGWGGWSFWGAKQAMAAQEQGAQAHADTAQAFAVGTPVAQLMGANLISPLTRRGYPLEYNLPALLTPGPAGVPPAKVWAPVDGTGGTTTRAEFTRTLVRELCYSFSLAVSNYRRTTYEGFHFFLWNGVRMNGLPIVSTLPPNEVDDTLARRIWKSAYNSFGGVSQPDLQLAPSADGYAGLLVALDFVGQTADKAMWLASADAPNAPKDEQPNEAALVLILAQPGFDSGRRPLAHFYAPVEVRHGEVPASSLPQTRGVDAQAARAAVACRIAIDQAAAQAGLQAQQIGTWVRDAGRNSPAAAQRFARFSAALKALKVEPADWSNSKQNIDMASLLGELGANTVNYSLLMASYAAYLYNHPVMYVCTQDDHSTRAMLVMPPPGHQAPAPRQFRYAGSLEEFNRPWWGERLDGKRDI